MYKTTCKRHNHVSLLIVQVMSHKQRSSLIWILMIPIWVLHLSKPMPQSRQWIPQLYWLAVILICFSSRITKCFHMCAPSIWYTPMDTVSNVFRRVFLTMVTIVRLPRSVCWLLYVNADEDYRLWWFTILRTYNLSLPENYCLKLDGKIECSSSTSQAWIIVPCFLTIVGSKPYNNITQ